MRRVLVMAAGAAVLAGGALPATGAVYQYRMDLRAERTDLWISNSKGQVFNCSPDGEGRWVYAGKGAGSLSINARGVRVRFDTKDVIGHTEEFRVNRGRVRQSATYNLTVEGSLAGCPPAIASLRPPDTSACGPRTITAKRPLRGWIYPRRAGTTILALSPKVSLYGARCPSEAPRQFHFESSSPAYAQIAAGRRRVVFRGSRVDMLRTSDLAMTGRFARSGSGRVVWRWNAVLTRVR